MQTTQTLPHHNPTLKLALGLLVTLLAFAPAAFAANRIWLGTPTDGNWSTAANWDLNTVAAANDTFVFTNSAITSVTNDGLGANANINALTFATGGDAFSIYGNAITLNGSITNNSANAQAVNLDTLIGFDRNIVGGPNVTLGGLTLNSGGNRTLFNWLTNGTVTLNNINLSESATARTFNILGAASGNAALANTTVTGVVANGSTSVSSLQYFGTGTLKFNGSAVTTYTGASSVTAGTLLLDFVNLATPVNLLNSASTLTLGGGTYSILGKSSGSTFQTNGNLTMTGGTGSGIMLNNNGGAGTTLRLGNLGGRGGNSTLHIDTSAGGTLFVGTTPTVANGIVSPAYATIKDSTGTGFATTSGNSIVRYTSATPLVDTANSPTVNYSYAADGTTFNWNNGITSRGVNSLAIDTTANSGVLDLGGAANVLTNSSRAIVMTGGNNFTIQNGQVGSASVEQIVHVMGTGVLTISGAIGTNTTSLTKGGPGTLILSGANTYSNGTFVAEGTLKQGQANALGNITRTLAVAAGGVMDLNGLDLGVGLLNGNGGGVIVNNGGSPATLTIGNGNPANANPVVYTLMDGASPLKLKMVGTAQLQISGASSWSGGTEVAGGNSSALRVNNSAGLGVGTVTLNDGGIFTPSGNPMSGGNGLMLVNTNYNIVGNSANNRLQNDINGFTYIGSFTGSGTVKVDENTRANGNAVFTGSFSAYTGTFNVAAGSGVSFEARMSQGGGASAKFLLSTTGSRIAFNGTGAVGTNVSLGELSGVTGTQLAGDNASKTFTIGALNTSTTFGGVIANGNTGLHNLVKVGTGTLTLGSAATYTGSTVVSNGLLFVSGLNSPSVNVYSPGALGGSGSVAGPVALDAGSAGLLLTNSAAATLTVGNGTTGLTLASGNKLAFDVAANPTSDTITVSGAFAQSGTATIYISQAAGFGAGTFTLISGASGISAANFTLGSSIPGYTLALSDDTVNLYLTVTVAAPAAAFWKGDLSGVWNANSGANYNWDTDQSSGIDLGALPANPTDVTFAADGAGNLITTLGANFGIHNLTFNTASAVTIGGANTLTIGGSVLVNSGSGNHTISASGVTLGVDQTWTVTDVAQTLSVSAPVGGAKMLTIAGAGKVALSGNNSYSAGTYIKDTATLKLDHPSDTLANAGAVAVDGGTLDLGANNDIVGGVFLTNGLIAGTSGVLTGAVYVVENGTVSARLGGSATLTKATGGTVLISGNNSYSGATSIAAGTLQLGSSTALGTGNATVVNGATLDLNGQTNNTVTSVVGAGASGGAIINSSNAPAAINAEIINGSSYTVNATGNITIQRTRSGGGTFTVTKEGPGTLILGTPAATSHNNLMALVINAGAVVLNLPGFLAIDRDPIAINNGSLLQLAGTGDNQIQDDRTITLNSGTFDLNGHSENIGHLNGSSGTIVTNSAASTTGTLSCGPGTLSADGSGLFDGDLVSGVGAVALSKTGPGVMTLTGNNTYTGTTTIGGGTVALTGSGVISGSALINVVSGATLDVISRTDGTLTLNSGQTLMGNGTITGMVTNLAGSTISPGASVGTLTASGDITLGGKLLIELSRALSPNHDQLLSSGGIINYGGTLSVTNIGAALQVNDTFQLFPAAVTTFTGISLATTDATGNTYTWDNKVAADGSIKVLTVTPPINLTPTNIITSLSGNTLTLSWPADHLGWKLQLQTNTLNVGLSGNWVTMPNSQNVTSTNIMIDPANGAVFFRMVYP